MLRKTKKLLAFLLALALILPTSFVGKNIDAEAAAKSTTRIGVHDPSIVYANGYYYLFGSHLAFARSKDLTNWSSVTNNVSNNYASIFASNGSWSALGSSNYNISGNLWAPDVIYNSTMRKWCMYMSINGDNYYSSIAMATADSIDGPYTYAGTVVYSGFANSTQAAKTDFKKVTGSNTVPSRYLSNGAWNSSYGPNAIDPCVFYDASGNLWMSYGSWFGGLFLLRLDKSTGLRDYNYTYSTTTNSSDVYLGQKISGGYGCTGEGSYITYDSSTGYYYLYVSYCGLDATDSFSGYHIRLFRSRNVTGPYTDAAGNNAICTSANTNQTTKGIKLFGNYYLSALSSAPSGDLSSNGYMSGGHNSAYIDGSGNHFLVYHTRFNTGNEYHQVRVHQQFLNADGWPCTAVYEYLGSTISSTGYSTSDMCGTYDFVNHGNSATTAYTGMLPTNRVYINDDGTITGDYSGTWSYTSGTYYCTMNINGVTYKGIFFKQYDESSSHTNRMTFSLIGNNDQCIWGSKTSNTQNKTASGSGSSSSGLNGTYYIKSKHSGLYLDVVNGSAENGTNIQQWEYNGSDAQKFKLVSDGNGYYSILTGASGYSSGLDVYNMSADNGTNIDQWENWNGDCQKFQVVKVSGNEYAIKTKISGNNSCLDVYDWSTENGGNIAQYEYWGGDCQLWYLEAVSSSGSSGSGSSGSGSSSSGSSSSNSLAGTYYIKSKHSNLYLDVADGSSANNANIRQWSYNGSTAQKFKLVSAGNGYYYIYTGASSYSKVVDVAGRSTADNANILQYSYNGQNNQKFQVVEVSSGVYAIKTGITSGASCLDVYDWSTEAGGNIAQYSYWGGDCQLWYLERTTE